MALIFALAIDLATKHGVREAASGYGGGYQ